MNRPVGPAYRQPILRGIHLDHLSLDLLWRHHFALGVTRVGSEQSEPSKGRISVLAPLARAIRGGGG